MFKLLTVSVKKLIVRDGSAGANLWLKLKHPWGCSHGLNKSQAKIDTLRLAAQGTLLGIQ